MKSRRRSSFSVAANQLPCPQLSLPVVIADFAAVGGVNEDISHPSRVIEAFVKVVATEWS
jgi:hypothetical protein